MGSHHAHDSWGARRAVGRKRLVLTLILTIAYMVAEVVGGIASNSLALLADAGHMLSDAAALGLTLFATWIGSRPASARRTYGHYRAEILAALANGAALIAIALIIVAEAWGRFRHPETVDGPILMGVAAGGLVLNLACLRLLSPGRHAGLHLHGAWLHVLSDALGSVGALAAGALAWGLGWQWADPAASVAIAVLIVLSSVGLLREAVSVLMESVPAHIDVEEVHRALAGVAGVREVHDLHVWTITSGLDSLSGHVVAAAGVSRDQLLVTLRETLETRFGIRHVTLQLEPEECGADPH